MHIDDGRKLRALAIVAQAGTIQRVNENLYKVKSQSGNGWYSVKKFYGDWECDCPDAVHRGVVCKHVFATTYSITLRDRALSQNFSPQICIPEPSLAVCKKCGSSETVKRGVRKNQSSQTQRFYCKSCGYRFVVNEGFVKMKNDGKIVCLALDLYFKNNSFRQIKDTIEQFYGIKLAHSTILRWVQKYVKVAREFVDGLTPNLSGIYHVDEMMVHVRKDITERGHYAWLWNLSDHDTRFLLSSRISQRREVRDARAVFKDAKAVGKVMPLAVVHDGLLTYNDAFNKEFWTQKNPKTQNIRSIGSGRDKGLNQAIERINNTVRDREKTMRGMDHDESAQILADGIRINYDFCRPHMGLGGKTPAQVAGIDLPIDKIRWLGLIKQAAASTQIKR